MDQLATPDDVKAWVLTQSSFFQDGWDFSNKKQMKQVCEDANKIVSDSSKILKNCTLTAYCVTQGLSIVVRFRLKPSGSKKHIIIKSSYEKHPTVHTIVNTVVDHCTHTALYNAGLFATYRLKNVFEPELSAKIKSAIAKMNVSDKTKQQVERNKCNIEARVRKAALERLKNEMCSYDFTEEDVIETWRLVQVEKIQKS
jgi:hypothetical protein